MTPIEWIMLSIAIFQGVLVPAAVIALKIWSKKTTDEKLRKTINEAVRAVEELKASDQLTIDKQEYVWRIIEKKFPKAVKQRHEIELLIHAAIQAASLGASAKLKDVGLQK